MLDNNDLQSIGSLIDKKFETQNAGLDKKLEIQKFDLDKKLETQKTDIIVAVGEMIDQNVMPVINRLDERLTRVEERLTGVEGTVSHLEGTIANLPTKEYLDRKLADLVVEIMQRIERRWKKEQEFKTKVTEILKRHNLAAPEEITYLEGLIAAG